MQQKRLMLRKYIIYQESAFCMWDISAGCKDVFNVFSVCWVRRLTSLFMAGDAVEEARMGRSSKATAFMFNFMLMMQLTDSQDLFSVFFSPFTRHPLRTEELSPEVTRNVLVSHLRFTSPDILALLQGETRRNQESAKTMKLSQRKSKRSSLYEDRAWTGANSWPKPEAATTRPRRRLPVSGRARPTPPVSLLSLPGELAYSYFQSVLLLDGPWQFWYHVLTSSVLTAQMEPHS